MRGVGSPDFSIFDRKQSFVFSSPGSLWSTARRRPKFSLCSALKRLPAVEKPLCDSIHHCAWNTFFFAKIMQASNSCFIYLKTSQVITESLHSKAFLPREGAAETHYKRAWALLLVFKKWDENQNISSIRLWTSASLKRKYLMDTSP